jgi:hypothetical protein
VRKTLDDRNITVRVFLFMFLASCLSAQSALDGGNVFVLLAYRLSAVRSIVGIVSRWC